MAPPSWLTLAVSLALLLTGCSGSPIQPPDPAANVPLVEKDGPLRTVRMNAGRALTYVQPETAAQILCQTVDRHRLDRLLDDQVSLRPERPPEAACTIGGARVALRLSLQPADSPFAPITTIAGRPAMPLPDNAGEIGIRVALTDDLPALRPATPARPLLDVTVVYAPTLDPSARRELAIRLAIEAIPLLTLAGDPIPDIDPTGRIPYTASPLIRGAQIVDLPQPLQALQLCTLLTDLLAPPTQPTPTDTARCTANPVSIALQATAKPPTDYPDTIAGRPARRTPTALLIRLRDDTQLDLSLTTPTPTPLAEHLIPLLLT